MAHESPLVSDLVAELRAAGGRITKARRAVLETLVSVGNGHLTADGLARSVRQRHPEIHRSTVYRTLDALEQLGLVTHVHLGHGPSTYHLAERLHHHAACQRCGAVIELPPNALDALARRLRRDYRFVLRHHFALVGWCGDCARHEEATAPASEPAV